MPVFNAERYMADALDSLLAQTYEHFELLIADNASTDRTEGICRAYCARDARIRYVRNRANVGAIANFNNVFRMSHGRFFKWAAYDDVCAPQFLERCVDVLERDPGVVLACSRIGAIDEDGRHVDFIAVPGPGQRPVANKHLDMSATVSVASADPTKRWRAMMRDLWWTPQLYGVIRAEVLARTHLHAQHYMGDHILLAELALHGRFHEVAGDLLFLRVHANKTSRTTGPLQRLEVSRPGAAPTRWAQPFRLILVYPERLAAHAATVRSAPLSRRQRLTCYVELLAGAARWAWWKAGARFRSGVTSGSGRDVNPAHLPHGRSRRS
jgi:glycosyltransferase involved in cell wall biosynthesis